MSPGDRDRLKATFDEVPKLYERVRPSYPAPLFQDLIELSELRADARVLEIGCGTGQATRPLAQRGYDILCIELGESLTLAARRELARYPRARVVNSSFETWDPGNATFDMMLAATSWHWLDPGARFVKAAAVLKSEGALAIVTTHHVLPDDGDSFFYEIQDVYNAAGENDSPPPHPHKVGDEQTDIEASNLFGDVKVRRYLWEQPYTAEGYVELLETYSGHRAMAAKTRRFLYKEIRRRIGARPAGLVRKHYLFTLHVAHRL